MFVLAVSDYHLLQAHLEGLGPKHIRICTPFDILHFMLCAGFTCYHHCTTTNEWGICLGWPGRENARLKKAKDDIQ
jgi:hypothetical protein